MTQLEVFFSSDYLRVIFFESSYFVNMVNMFFCDDTLHKLGSFHASLTTTEPGAKICAGKMHCGGSVVVVDSLYIQFCSHCLQLAYLINTCELTIHADPESFVRGGQILTTFFLV